MPESDDRMIPDMGYFTRRDLRDSIITPSRDVVYGAEAQEARRELLAIRMRCTALLREMRQAWKLGPDEQRRVEEAFNAELAKLDALENRVFGPEQKEGT